MFKKFPIKLNSDTLEELPLMKIEDNLDEFSACVSKFLNDMLL